MRSSITHICGEAFAKGTIPKELNRTYICLIPKNRNASTLKEYRLISLCNTTYKIITKIITSRLCPIMERFIEPYQSSSLANRQTSDNAIIVQEVVSYLQNRKGKKAHMLLKLDLEKAFVNLNDLCSRHTRTFQLS